MADREILGSTGSHRRQAAQRTRSGQRTRRWRRHRGQMPELGVAAGGSTWRPRGGTMNTRERFCLDERYRAKVRRELALAGEMRAH